jgi:hypothetical protein
MDVLDVRHDAHPGAFNKSESLIYDWNDVDVATHLDEMHLLNCELRDLRVTEMN